MRLRRGRGEESGFTVAELMVTLSISSVVMVSVVGMMVSQSNAERRVSNFADNQEVARQAIVAIQRDIRSSEPLKQLATSPEYALRVDLDVYEDILVTNPTPIRWIVDVGQHELRRELLDTNGAVIGTTHRLKGVTNNAAQPLFSFYKANGVAYDLAADQPKDIAECTIRVHINLFAAPTPGPKPAQLVSDAELRNRLPGGVGCPQTQLTTTTL